MYLQPAMTGFSYDAHTPTLREMMLSGQTEMRTSAASPTAVMYGAGRPAQQGMSFNIMGANKPKKLELLSLQHIKKFKSDFTHYFHETNEQATLLGHMSDEVVTIVDALLGAQEKHRHLLCHGDDVEFATAGERRADGPQRVRLRRGARRDRRL